MLKQEKIELALLYWLYAQNGGSSFTDSARAKAELSLTISESRIRSAFQSLQSQGWVKEESAPDQEIWEITDAGVRQVEKYVGNSATFIGRLRTQGFSWLHTDEAAAARLSPGASKNVHQQTNEASTSNANPALAPSPATQGTGINPDADRVDWTKWGAIFAALAIVVAILIAVVD